MKIRNPQEYAVTVEICNPRTGEVDHMQVMGRSEVETQPGWSLTDAYRRKNPWIVEAPGTPVRQRPGSAQLAATSPAAQVPNDSLLNPSVPPVVAPPTKPSSKK